MKNHLIAIVSVVVILVAVSVCAQAQTVRTSVTLSSENVMPSNINSYSPVPVGTVVAFQSGNQPSNPGDWLACDGSPIDPQYSQLIAVLGSDTLPDMRQEFLRGGDASNVGKAVPDSIKSHVVSYVEPTIVIGPAGGGAGFVPATQQGEAQYAGTSPNGVDETAPRHLYTIYYIKARQ
jgi:hypothetical protein